MALEHGYLEDIMVHPYFQNRGIGVELVQELLSESERYGLEIVTLTYDQKLKNFYECGGFSHVLVGFGIGKIIKYSEKNLLPRNKYK
jgi:ribosomal protein S18 acetylase RimI-like enzyme